MSRKHVLQNVYWRFPHFKYNLPLEINAHNAKKMAD